MCDEIVKKNTDEQIKSAWSNVWRAATDQPHKPLMSIPVNETEDHDRIISNALEELFLRRRTDN